MDAVKIYLECEQHSKEQLKSDVKYLNNVINILQQENQQLKRNCNIGNENLKFYRQENQQLKDRINRAIEYIEEEDNSELGIYQTKFLGKKDLLEILKEDNKEE